MTAMENGDLVNDIESKINANIWWGFLFSTLFKNNNHLFYNN